MINCGGIGTLIKIVAAIVLNKISHIQKSIMKFVFYLLGIDSSIAS